MASTSSASAKHGERNAKHATAHGAGVRCPVTTISCIKILSSWPNEAKNSCVLRLLISVIYVGQHEAPLDAPAAGSPAHAQRRQVRRNRLLSLSGQHRRDAQRRTATSMPKTALPPFLVETVNIALPIPVYFMRSVGSTVAVFFWETPTRPTCKWLGTISVKCTCVTSSRRCVQHAQCRHIAERRADGAAIDWRTARCPTDAGLDQTRRGTGESDIRGDLGARQASR